MTDVMKKLDFSGAITYAGMSHNVTFHAHAAEDSRLHIEIDPISIPTYFALTKALGEPGEQAKDLSLQGAASDGTTFDSNTIYLRGHRTQSSTATITVGMRSAKVAFIRDKPIERPAMRLWLRGFRSFRNPEVEMFLGKVYVQGNTNVETTDDVSGSVAVQSETGTISADWASKADEFLTFMLRGLCFAHGSRLQTPRCDFYMDKRAEHTFYDGRASRSGFPNVPFLAHGDFIKSLVARYESKPALSDMVWTAVGWSQLDITADHSRFVNCMTALETIVEHLVPKGQTTVMPKPAFKAIMDPLTDLISASALSNDEKAIFIGKIKNMNSRTLSQKIDALRAHYGLPADKYDTPSIVKIIQLRNAIIHTGISDNTNIWPDFLFARELIADIVFSELKYAGVRESYLGGYKLVNPMRANDPGGADIVVD